MTTRWRRSKLFLLATLMWVQTAAAQVNIRTNYDFPYEDPYLSSLSIRLLQPSKLEPETMMIDGLPGREDVPILGGRERIEVMVLAQKKPAPLVFLVPGTGGNATEGGMKWLAEQLYTQGYSVINLPNPFFWKFVLSQSSTAIPGFTPEDARDLRRLMIVSKKMAEQQYKLRATNIAAVGYSLGALNAAFVLKLEREEPLLGLERVVMINPPVKVTYAIDEIDRLYQVGAHWSRDAKDSLWGYVLNVGIEVLSRDPQDPMYFMGLDKTLQLQKHQLQFLIGDSFRQTLGDTIFASQQVNDLGILKQKASPLQQNARQAEAKRYSFNDYLKTFAWPFWTKKLNKSWTLEQFIAQGDLWSHREWIAKEPGLRMMHNMDDFITQPEQITALAAKMGQRAIVYPKGGHVGNFWHQMNREDLINCLKF